MNLLYLNNSYCSEVRGPGRVAQLGHLGSYPFRNLGSQDLPYNPAPLQKEGGFVLKHSCWGVGWGGYWNKFPTPKVGWKQLSQGRNQIYQLLLVVHGPAPAEILGTALTVAPSPPHPHRWVLPAEFLTRMFSLALSSQSAFISYTTLPSHISLPSPAHAAAASAGSKQTLAYGK